MYLFMGLIKTKTFRNKWTEMRSDEDEKRNVRAEEGGGREEALLGSWLCSAWR